MMFTNTFIFEVPITTLHREEAIMGLHKVLLKGKNFTKVKASEAFSKMSKIININSKIVNTFDSRTSKADSTEKK